MKQQLENIRQLSLEQIANAATPAEIDDIRVRVLGKKGEVTAILKQMGKRKTDAQVNQDIEEGVQEGYLHRIQQGDGHQLLRLHQIS
mgnify:CR=1 FL=1